MSFIEEMLTQGHISAQQMSEHQYGEVLSLTGLRLSLGLGSTQTRSTQYQCLGLFRSGTIAHANQHYGYRLSTISRF